MEKGFRTAQCNGCPAQLRLNNITKAKYGKTFEVTCPRCGTKGRVTIPHPPQDPQATAEAELFEQLFGKLNSEDLKDFAELFKDKN